MDPVLSVAHLEVIVRLAAEGGVVLCQAHPVVEEDVHDAVLLHSQLKPAGIFKNDLIIKDQ